MNVSSSAENELEFLPINSKIKTQSTILSYSTCTHSRSRITLLGLNADGSEQNKREFNDQPLMGSSRWNPTPEQLLALEEMYRRGTRTPTAEQIQQIASQLRRFGKIEGKNVFYWFQNHKARERQKRRREMEAHYKLRKPNHLRSLDKEVSGLKRTVHELEQKNHSNCSDQHLEGPFPMHRIATEESLSTYRRSYFEERELHQQKSASPEKNHTWSHAMDSYPSSSPIHLINDMDATSSRFLSIHWQNSWFKPKINAEEVETLELFPLSCNSREDLNQMNGSKETNVPIRAINTKLNPNQYIEFLPLKN